MGDLLSDDLVIFNFLTWGKMISGFYFFEGMSGGQLFTCGR